MGVFLSRGFPIEKGEPVYLSWVWCLGKYPLLEDTASEKENSAAVERSGEGKEKPNAKEDKM